MTARFLKFLAAQLAVQGFIFKEAALHVLYSLERLHKLFELLRREL